MISSRISLAMIPGKRSSITLITLILASAQAVAQPQESECLELEGTPPGLYVTVDQNQVYLTKDGEVMELNPGETAYANDTQLACLKVPPRVLAWPCGSAEALTRRMAPAFSLDELPPVGAVQEVKRRYFDENTALGPPIEWLNGDNHGKLHASEFNGLDTSSYWYLPGGPDPFASPKRPRSQLISLFWSTRQAVLDTNTLDQLRVDSDQAGIPVVFLYHRDYEVPISFFGADVNLAKLQDVFLDKGIQVAPVPVWYAGDHHLKVSISEFERLFDIPAADEISPARMQALTEELNAYGFTHMPILVSMMAESYSMILDQPERVRAAAELGINDIPTVIFYYTSSSHLDKCGLSLPQISGVSGAAAKSAESAQDALDLELPAHEQKASDS
jgi:hypothetical protein